MKRMICALLALLLTAPACAETIMPDDIYCNWYEIFVYSYQDSNGDRIGDIQGLISRLDYVKDMGFTGIWLMPIMPSPSYHKYDVTDYMDIDPQYGTLDDFRKLVKECHARGIKLIIDMPLNHSSLQHPWFIEAAKALRAGDTDNKYVSYYNFRQEGGMKYIQLSGTDWYYEEQFEGGGMPDLNLDNEDVMTEIRAIFDFWLNDVDVDGFRLDAVTSYYASDTVQNVAKLSEINNIAKELKPGCYIVGEAWTSLTDIAEYYKSGIDSFFLFPAAQAEGYIARVVRDRSPGKAYAKFLNQTYEAIPEGILAPFIANHDTGRAIGSLQARSAPDRAKFAEGLVNMMGGATFTYYGEEIGMVGAGDDPNKRLAMYWNDGDMTSQPPGVTKEEYAYPCVDDQIADKNSLLNYVKALNHLKLSVPAIARGKNEFIFEDAFLCVMKRIWNDEVYYIAINFSASETAAYTFDDNLILAGELTVSDAACSVIQTDGGTSVELPPFAIAVLSK
ncbi:MAG: hypothetical protein IJC56_03315 [Clostridia bacterium]|nr:hypothetical protein [Clostridia bacterium]